ncbi:glycoside hydrolase family 99-like domain-containing protein [Dyella terrae]|uniref:glycoside hydrolase family 99-like domain-containing protein n=1 Tax=Dyella terrae TaxID=522259 RepID=UPI001EFD0153|nr:glycoside hydrolase family 99-like domain-containing protein [Dyella terrae]ULU25209.1 glycoside hydrolase family 99-like domain-containing protein [Dyella terrae]
MTGPRSPFEDFLRASAYRQDESHRIWHKEDEKPFAYSDGDEVEQRIAHAIADSSDVSQFSRELHQHMTDWASTYHLSPTRANLLRPLTGALKGSKVLEIGAGCGAITRFLGEQGANVLALEGSRRRASIAASRCRDLANVTVLNEQFGELRSTQRFDIVTLIGVLEYARMYTTGNDPVLETLKLARELLTDDGILVVAIENQLGLKYFAGVAEDHLDRAMAGIQDQYDEGTVVTFGKGELESYLRKAGFESSECAIPLPDYKLPHCVVLPEGTAARGEFNAASLAGQASRSDRQLVTMPLFSLGRAFDVVGRNGLLADLANSFLMVARKSERSPSFSSVLPNVLAEQYSSGRDPAFAKSSRFVRKNGAIVVEHLKLSPQSTPNSKLLIQSLEEEPYFQGEHWGDALESIVTKPDWTIEQVANWFGVWKDALAGRLPGSPSSVDLMLDTPVPASMVDAVPRNLIRDANGQTTFFDLEWAYKVPLTFGYLAFRAIKLSFGSLTGVTRSADPRLLHVPTLVQAILREHGLVMTSSHIQTYLDLEASLRDEAIGDYGVPLEFDAYKKDYLGVLPDVSRLLREGNLAPNSQHAELERKHAELEPKHAELERKHAELEQQYGETQDAYAALETEMVELHESMEHLTEVAAHLTQELDITESDKRTAGDKLRKRIRDLETRMLDLIHYEQLAKSQAEELELITHSLSWSLTKPLRHGSAASRRIKFAVRRRTALAAKSAYRMVPLSPGAKNRLKSVLFNHTGFLFRRTGAYQRWQAYERTHAPSDGAANGGATPDYYVQSPDMPANVLWRADGKREWADYSVVRQRIDATLREQQLAQNPQKFTTRDFSNLDVDTAAKRIRLPELPSSPEVTILVPVYNHLTTTLECLASIADHAGSIGPSFEVLIANDASTDESHRVLSTIPHLRVVSQPNNLGFLRNCNAAATHANGRHLVLLNNDVQVTKGWLEALIACLDRSADIGAVGPRIAYPTGWLQEAGTTLHADGTSEMVGLNDLPDQPRYAFERDVDYCSGACLAIRTEDFRRLGGFDEMYAPAYCEDSDLCMRLRAEGRRIVYCPDATVLHHLSRTSDGLTNDYKLRCISTNLAKFTTRWGNELERMDDVRTIAFYLPQFHPFPENDLWWGPGFTEWTNVTKARPNYVGHYQPRVPADLGYYDLRVTETMEKQAALAQRYGLSGFCYYYYWFAGHRLLERPIENMLLTGRPDFPFCLCWANENWTRRWDGQEHDVLMAQKHSDDDDVAVIRDLIRYFRSPNYIRVNGKPLILIYRVTLFPDFARTTSIWREVCRDEGIGEIYIAQVESFELVSAGIPPGQLGCDAAVEFTPQGLAEPRPVTAPLLNPEFQGAVADYRDIAVRYATRELPPYKRFMGGHARLGQHRPSPKQ